MTKGQEKDLETIKYFIPDCMKEIEITNNDIKMFFENSERGLHKEKVLKGGMKNKNWTGFDALIWGKTWRGIHMHELYEPGILDGSMPYWVILGGYYKHEIMPRLVVDFMKKEMFKGMDAEVIKKTYQEILCYWGIKS